MKYLYFYFLTIKPEKKQNSIELLRNDRGEIIHIGPYTSDPEHFKHDTIPPKGLLVWAKLSSKKDARILEIYLKSIGQVEQVVVSEPYFLLC